MSPNPPLAKTQGCRKRKEPLCKISTFAIFIYPILSTRCRPGSATQIEHVRRRDLARAKIHSAIVGFSGRHAFDSEIFALALPTLGAVLIDPCLSLVDTGFVGRLGALSLAAIGPCAAAFNFVFITAR